MQTKLYFGFVLCIAVLQGVILTCMKSTQPDDGWKTCMPCDVNMDEHVLSDLVSKMHQGELGNIDGLIIVKDGMLVVDEYENNYNLNKVHQIQSDTKSITSLLIGIARDHGKIRSVDEKMLDYFKDSDIKNLDIMKESIKLVDLLTMRGGFDWDEFATPISNSNPVMKMNNSPDWLKTAINAPMKYSPGSVFQYNSGGVIILDHVLKVATGLHADAFAQKFLFAPLGIKYYFWSKQPELVGTPHTGGGLYLRPRDLAKIGQMVLDKGLWDGNRIVSEEWLEESFQQACDVNLGVVHAGYGYLWWLFPNPYDSQRNIYSCVGAGGQYMFIVPDCNMVIVIMSDEFDGRLTALEKGTNILYNYALKALKDVN